MDAQESEGVIKFVGFMETVTKPIPAPTKCQADCIQSHGRFCFDGALGVWTFFKTRGRFPGDGARPAQRGQDAEFGEFA